MTFLTGYVVFGIPALALVMAYTAVRLHERSIRQADDREAERRETRSIPQSAAPNAVHRNAP